MGINPAYSQERFAEAHDLIIRAWTEPGPFQYVGKHYQFNYVNPWPRPYQTPHPPIWIPSQGSSSTIKWAAQMRYTYAQTLSPIAVVARMFQMYRDEAEKAGYEASPDQLAWSNTIYVAETDEKAMREARPHIEAMVNRFLKMPTEMLLPPGYSNIESMKRIRAAKITGQAADARRPGAERRGHRRQPEHGAREARRVSGPRRLQHVADQDAVRHDAGRHGPRQHACRRRGNPAALPRSPAAGAKAGGGGVENTTASFRGASEAREPGIQTRRNDGERTTMNMLPRRKFIQLAGLAAASSALPRPALAQAYPTRPVKLVVAFTAGGTTDLLARLLAQPLSERLGQPVVIENKPGGGTNIGLQQVVNAPPDGYTIGMTFATNTINPSLYKTLPFDYQRDIAPVSGLADLPLVLVVNKDVPAKNVTEFLAYAKSNPAGIAFASFGARTISHLAIELLKTSAGFNFVHVPYPAGPQIITDLIAGRVQAGMDALPNSLAHIRSGAVRALAVMSPQRNPAIPDVPAMNEIVAGLEINAGTGIGVAGEDAAGNRRAAEPRHQRMPCRREPQVALCRCRRGADHPDAGRGPRPDRERHREVGQDHRGGGPQAGVSADRAHDWCRHGRCTGPAPVKLAHWRKSIFKMETIPCPRKRQPKRPQNPPRNCRSAFATSRCA